MAKFRLNKLRAGLCLLVVSLGLSACMGSLRTDGEAASFYVAPDGDDSNAGTYEQPFATPERARDAVRKLKEESGLPEGGVTVYLRGGKYRLKKSFELGRQDSGQPDAPVTYSAYKGEEVTLTGGIELDASTFEPVTDEAILNRLPQGSRGEVYQIDLSDRDVDPLFLPA